MNKLNQLNEYTSPETGQRLEDVLKGAGYDIEPQQRWRTFKDLVEVWKKWEWDKVMKSEFKKQPPAFSMGQLFNLLPKSIDAESTTYFKSIIMTTDGAVVTYMRMTNRNQPEYIASSHDKTAVGALAMLVIWCIENNYPINATKANKNTPS